jgi:hypothetical protein
MPYFDAYLVAPQQPAETPPPQLTGAILYGPGAAEQRRVCSTWHAGGLWHDAGTLDCLVGPGDPRFPAGAPLVVDLQLPDGELPRCLKKPAADWWPLANGLAGSRQFLRLNLPPGIKLYVVDASKIAMETVGKNVPNTPMLGALVKATGLVDYRKMLEDTRKKLEKKFRSKPEVIEGNIKAI